MRSKSSNPLIHGSPVEVAHEVPKFILVGRIGLGEQHANHDRFRRDSFVWLTSQTKPAPEQSAQHFIRFPIRDPLGHDAPERRIKEPPFREGLGGTDYLLRTSVG